jgi:hypothetical protein
MAIDWSNPQCPISTHFTVHEALWLPSWGRHATVADGLNDAVKANLVSLFAKMDVVRNFINKPIRVHVAYRPPKYNALPSIGGAKHSAHMALDNCAAVDWSADMDGDGLDGSKDCDYLRSILLPMLPAWNMRMEKRPGSNWVHLDDKPLLPGGNRYFLP